MKGEAGLPARALVASRGVGSRRERAEECLGCEEEFSEFSAPMEGAQNILDVCGGAKDGTSVV